MPKNKPLPTSAPESIEEAWATGDELAMARAVVRKYARVLDMTDSGRDIKPLATGMFEAIERVRALEAAQSDAQTVPLLKILSDAENDEELMVSNG
jgi:hypothetical protein